MLTKPNEESCDSVQRPIFDFDSIINGLYFLKNIYLFILILYQNILFFLFIRESSILLLGCRSLCIRSNLYCLSLGFLFLSGKFVFAGDPVVLNT